MSTGTNAAGIPSIGNDVSAVATAAGEPASFEQFSTAVRRILVDHVGVDASRVDADFDFIVDGTLDSIATIELFLSLQAEFGPHLLDGEINLADMNTPSKLYRRYLLTRSAPHAAE